MEKQIAEGKLGSVGQYDVEFKDGKLVAKIQAQLQFGNAGIHIEVGAEQVIDAIAKAVPGKLDDLALEMLKKALA